MANAAKNQEGLMENLRKQLAVAVKSIQWSYAIFWSLSATQQGVLEWGDGYYNGDFQTRKTVQAMELKPDKIGLQRSMQLRELYESLLEVEGETEQANKRPSAALSPEDLTDAEWYYLVCMSFVFNSGQGLPGKALANGETIWLCNADYADSKTFSRSLLAKSASIQTLICFPHLDGVIELGITELVPEDPSLLQHIKASLLDFSKPVCSEKSSSPYKEDDDSDPVCAKLSHEMSDSLALESLYYPKEEKNFDGIGDSPDECSKGFEHNEQTEDSLMLDGINEAASQVHSWHFLDDDFSNGISDSLHSSDCISEALLNQAKIFPSSKGENMNHIQLKGLQEDNYMELSSLDLGTVDEMQYLRTVTAIFGSPKQLTQKLSFLSVEHKSSFVTWKKGGMVDGNRPRIPQNILKKILFTVPLMYGGCTRRSQKELCRKDCPTTMGSDDFCIGHISSYMRRENEKFMLLRSMVPSISEVDKTSILNDTAIYLKKLQARRVEELESCMDSVDSEAIPKRNYQEMVEQTSDNYNNKKIDDCKKPWINKRKACDIDETEPELDKVLNLSDVTVSTKEKDVLIEMRCPFREYIWLDIMDAINNLHLDTYSVVSSNLDGVLTLALKSKFRGAAIAPAGMIKQALWKIAGK